MDSCRLPRLSCLAHRPKEEGWRAVGKGRNKPGMVRSLRAYLSSLLPLHQARTDLVLAGTAGSMSAASPPRPVRCHTVRAPFSLALFVFHLRPLAARLKPYRHPAPITKIRDS
jgi:hypothetical protein